jgi:hypothetical protein
MTVLCITIRPLYDAMLVILGPEGFLFSYTDDVYMDGAPGSVALALVAASNLNGMTGLQLEWGSKKTELILLLSCDLESLPLPRDHSGTPLPDAVIGFKACLGVPRHTTNNDFIIAEALRPVPRRHDNLLDLVYVVFDEDPFVALRLLQVCSLNRFGHILSTVPPSATANLCAHRDAAIAATMGAIHGIPVDLV